MTEYIRKETALEAYSSDASIYAIRPKAIVSVNAVDDIIGALQFAENGNIPVYLRGSGTGLAGGAVGNGIILDFSPFRKIIEIDTNNKTVLTQPGIVYDELNYVLKQYGLFFPPDPSSGDSCQIGGMLANNSSGPRSVKYGLTSYFVEELTIVKPRGTLVNLKKLNLDSEALPALFSEHPEYRKIYDILQRNKGLILSKWPKVKKNSAGYNLRQVAAGLEKGTFDLPALYIGSEGTLGIFVSVKLRLLDTPKELLTARLYFKSLLSAGQAVQSILLLEPSGLEIVDGSTLDLIGREKFGIPPGAEALLLVEFDDNASLKKSKLEKLASKFRLETPVEFAADPISTAELWRARKAIVPTLYRHHPRKRPLPLIEDVSLPPSEIPSFIEYIVNLFDSHELVYGIFGHIGDGNLHIRPLFDLNSPDDMKLAGELYEKVYDRVISIGGSTTAEHADGRLRASLVRKIYGDEIYEIFVKIKKLIDPDNILSPGIIISDETFDKNIDYRKIESYCAACGKCNGYCPVHDIFRREDFSPRGWLRIINQSEGSKKEILGLLSYCLNCKNCAMVCPAGVDIASEIIDYKSSRSSLRARVVGKLADSENFLGLSLKLGRMISPVLESSFGGKIAALLGKVYFGLDESLRLPRIARRKLRDRFPEKIATEGEIAYFHGCADNLLESAVGEAIFKVFGSLEKAVYLPPQKCCGLPYEVHGLRANLIEKARYNIENLERFDAIIFSCASCLLRVKEYGRLFADGDPNKARAISLAEKCHDISQFINKLNIDYSIFNSRERIDITYHNPCHLRAAGLHKEPEKLFAKLENANIIHPEYADRCCAQAGSYGFVHFQESKEMFLPKRQAYSQINAGYLMTSCPACQMKIRAEMGEKFKVTHPIEILAELLDKK
jgi:FAD/FMN-containing dehydrogenase/Fe-S oxidoreductase